MILWLACCVVCVGLFTSEYMRAQHEYVRAGEIIRATHASAPWHFDYVPYEDAQAAAAKQIEEAERLGGKLLIYLAGATIALVGVTVSHKEPKNATRDRTVDTMKREPRRLRH